MKFWDGGRCNVKADMFEDLADVLNKLERIVFSLDVNKPKEENEVLVAEFFKTFKGVKDVFGEEYLDVKSFVALFDKEDLLECSRGFFVDWNSGVKSFTVRWDYERRVEFIRNGLQSLVWGLLGKALRYMPSGWGALAQTYEDLLNGFGNQTDTETLEILYQLGLDGGKVYRDYMAVKEKYKIQIKTLKALNDLRRIISVVKEKGFNHKTRVMVNDWWSSMDLFTQLDTALLNEFDYLAYQLISLNTLVRLEKLYRKNEVEGVQHLLSPHKRPQLNNFDLIEGLVRTQLLSNLIGEEAIQRLKTNPTCIPALRRQLESCIMETLQTLNVYVEKKLESCLKADGANVKRASKDPPFTVLYHTFFAPILYGGKKEKASHAKALNVSFEEMVKEVEAFNPDRFKEFPLWWAKERFKEKISNAKDREKEELIKVFYKLVKGKITIEKYHDLLNSVGNS